MASRTDIESFCLPAPYLVFCIFYLLEQIFLEKFQRFQNFYPPEIGVPSFSLIFFSYRRNQAMVRDFIQDISCLIYGQAQFFGYYEFVDIFLCVEDIYYVLGLFSGNEEDYFF